jgi:CheY-like chemotaxis protein
MSRTVLVVDDDPNVLEVVAAMLEDLGCDAVTAESSRAGSARAKSANSDTDH